MQIDSYVVHVVDDEEAVRKSLAFLLTMTGFTVRVHESASSFLEAAQNIGKACLITDLRMPDMNGVELLEQLNERGSFVPRRCHHRPRRHSHGCRGNESRRRRLH